MRRAPIHLDTPVPGLALLRAPDDGQWRLVHAATGRLLSRSSVHRQPDALYDLASQVAELTDWTNVELSAPGPRLRAELSRVVDEWRARQGAERPSDGPPSAPVVARSWGRSIGKQFDQIEGLRRLVRHLYGAVPPGRLSATVRSLAQGEQELLLEVVANDDDEVTGVLQVIRAEDDFRSTRHRGDPSATPPASPIQPPTSVPTSAAPTAVIEIRRRPAGPAVG
jgi:hypothetical protein